MPILGCTRTPEGGRLRRFTVQAAEPSTIFQPRAPLSDSEYLYTVHSTTRTLEKSAYAYPTASSRLSLPPFTAALAFSASPLMDSSALSLPFWNDDRRTRSLLLFASCASVLVGVYVLAAPPSRLLAKRNVRTEGLA